MIRTALTIVCKICPWVETFTLTDTSHVPCTLKNNKSVLINLAHFSLITNGKTYYEKYLGATIQDVGLLEKYNTGIARLLDSQVKPTTLKSFNQAYGVKLEMNPTIINIYNKSRTLLDFFKGLKADQGSNFCFLVEPWLDTFVSTITDGLNIGMCTWVIKKDNVKNIDVDIHSHNENMLTWRSTVNVYQEEFSEFYKSVQQNGGARRYRTCLGTLSEHDI